MASTENKLKNDSADSVASTGTEKSPTKSSAANGAPDIDERKFFEILLKIFIVQFFTFLPIVSMIGCACVCRAARVWRVWSKS